ncbi:MAG: sulfatase-like hydrolase/transferase [Pirellulaceae bacterium]|jgi:arylsulfatase A-like enzyme|nr:sulfatase-like hydrolase/transferase [Pirellulaceae bacterium]
MANDARPNVIVINTDDQDLLTLDCYVGSARTPNIDMLAEQGVKFTSAYASSGLC